MDKTPSQEMLAHAEKLCAQRGAEGVEDIMHTLAARMGFALRHNVIEAHGLCAGCVEVEACSTPGHCQHDHTIQLKKKAR